MKHLFVDTRDLTRKYAVTKFKPPTQRALDLLRVGDSVVICALPERFWVEVTEVNGTIVHGVITSDVLATREHGFKRHDRVEFFKRSIYKIL